jgi:hypothetical protein
VKDLIVLTADRNIEYLMKGFLPRLPKSSKLEKFSFEVYPHIQKDSGCYNTCHNFLRPFIKQFKFALVIFDHEGCGKENLTREEIEKMVETKLSSNGWENRCAVITISPELENWIWIDNPNVERTLDWDNNISLYKWLRDENYLKEGEYKPKRPKEILELVLRKTGKAFSSSIHNEIASKASYKNCVDPAFNKMINVLNKWFKKD